MLAEEPGGGEDQFVDCFGVFAGGGVTPRRVTGVPVSAGGVRCSDVPRDFQPVVIQLRLGQRGLEAEMNRPVPNGEHGVEVRSEDVVGDGDAFEGAAELLADTFNRWVVRAGGDRVVGVHVVLAGCGACAEQRTG